MKKITTTIVLLLFLSFVLVSFPQIGLVKAESTIYIRADGSVEGTDKIQRDGNVYTFADDLFAEIVVEKDNIMVEGNGFKLHGSGVGNGLDLNYASNVTVKNTKIQNYTTGIVAGGNNTLSGNTITGNLIGIYLTGDDCFISGNRIIDNDIAIAGGGHNVISGNTITDNDIGLQGAFRFSLIYGNNITNNKFYGLYFHYSNNNTISGNTITHNRNAIAEDVPRAVALYFLHCWDNNISENNISDNDRGIRFFFDSTPSYNNTIYLNNFVNNDVQVLNGNVSVNFWDNGVEGNYWSNYNGTDSDGDGIGDTPYVIDENNQDNYPLVNVIPEFPSWTIMLLILAVLAVAVAVYRVRLTKIVNQHSERCKI